MLNFSLAQVFDLGKGYNIMYVTCECHKTD